MYMPHQVGAAKRFDMAVLRVNDAPSFTVASDELHIDSGPGERTVVFARNVSAGLNEEAQHIRCAPIRP